MEIFEEVTTKKKIKVHPCVKCGNEDIEFLNCGYSTFNVGYGECKKCKYKIKVSLNWDAPDSEIAKVWNKANNPKVLRANYEKEILRLQDMIASLPSK